MQEHELETVRSRLARLEAQHRGLKRVGVLCLLLLGAVVITAQSKEPRRPKVLEADKVLAGEFVLQDAKGRTRARLFHDPDGDPRLSLFVGSGGVLWTAPGPGARQRKEAFRRCERYFNLAKTWQLMKKSREPPRDIEILEQPLRPGGDPLTKLEPDPWGGRYRIEIDGRRFRILSDGPDGKAGTEDDIRYPSENR